MNAAGDEGVAVQRFLCCTNTVSVFAFLGLSCWRFHVWAGSVLPPRADTTFDEFFGCRSSFCARMMGWNEQAIPLDFLAVLLLGMGLDGF